MSFTAHGATTAQQLERGQQEFAHLLFGGIARERLENFVDTLGEVLDRLRDAVVSDDS